MMDVNKFAAYVRNLIFCEAKNTFDESRKLSWNEATLLVRE